jgi:hypothetical protein
MREKWADDTCSADSGINAEGFKSIYWFLNFILASATVSYNNGFIKSHSKRGPDLCHR